MKVFVFWTLVFYASATLTGVSAVGIWAAVFSQLDPKAPWTARLLLYFGQGLVVSAVVFIVGALFGLAVVAVQAIF